MQFKNPEVFYFLVLLLIPIIVHLFQLQKFRKVAFTNVAFLKKISLETRKSSRLKKWLILSTRLLGLLALLFVFSQPYLSDKNSEVTNHNFIYLDNSLSLNTNGSKGNQLRVTAQDIINSSSDFDIYTLVTNDDNYKNIDKTELVERLKNINFSSKPSNLDQILLLIQSKKINESNYLNKNILISDYQNVINSIKNKFTNVNTSISGVKLNNIEENNVSIDSVSINDSTADEITVSVTVRNQGESKKDLPIALYNKDELISKRSFSIKQDSQQQIDFVIPKATKFYGRIEITFNDIFLFDNTFLFHVSDASKTNILSIGKDSNSLRKIFQNDSFNFERSSLQNTNYNSLSEQQLIILNELESIPNVLQNSLDQFVQNGGHLLIIPNKNLDFATYNSFLKKMGSGRITAVKNSSLKITGINFDHPLYSNVFSKRVNNFQYPYVSKSYETNLKGSQVISFENNKPFLQEIQNPFSKIYWFSSPLNLDVTNFSNSPLIVPTLFNIGQQSLQLSKPYYQLQEENNIEIPVTVGKDDILTISGNNSSSFIPLQQSYSNKVRITTQDDPKTAGFYDVLLKNDTISSLAFNVSNEESNLDFMDISEISSENSNIEFYDSVSDLFTNINQKNEVQWLWKLFLVIAIVSLLLEILILKFFKT